MPTAAAKSHPTDRASAALVAALLALVLASHVTGALHPGGWAWGVNVYAFWPLAVLGVATVLMLGAIVALSRHAPAPPSGVPSPRARLLVPVAAAIVAGVACAWFRSRTALLGDGLAILMQPRGAPPLHPLEPLAAWIEGAVRQALPAAPGAAGAIEQAWRAAALTSIVAGALFAPVAIAIAGELAAIGASSGAAEPDRRLAPLLAVALAGQGYALVFFGYVENYALGTLGQALYLLAALRFLRGRGSLLVCGVALALAVALHLSAAASAPSFLVLVARGLADGGSRRRTLRDAGILAGLAVAAIAVVAVATRGYNLGAQLVATTADVLRGDRSFRPEYRGSLAHVRDFLNGQALAGPLAAWLFVPAVALAAGRSLRDARVAFFVTCGGVTVVAAALAGDSNLGYARNWDLMAAYACVLTVCGLGLVLARGPGRPMPRWAVPALAALSLFHAAPWIALNASTERSLARFATLPLGMGRVESTLGYWYALRGEPLEAERHYARSLEENPANLRAHLGLAAIYRRRGDTVGEILALREAVSLRPADPRARALLLDALVRGHIFDAAIVEATELAALRPSDPSLAVARGVVLALARRDSAAAHALNEAQAWAHGDPAVAAQAARARAALHDAGALERLWSEEFATPETPVP